MTKYLLNEFHRALSVTNMKTTVTSGPRSLLTRSWCVAVEYLAVPKNFRWSIAQLEVVNLFPVHPIGTISRLVSPTISSTREKSCQPPFELLSPLRQKRPVQWLQLK